jgi:hypothetical protein
MKKIVEWNIEITRVYFSTYRMFLRASNVLLYGTQCSVGAVHCTV